MRPPEGGATNIPKLPHVEIRYAVALVPFTPYKDDSKGFCVRERTQDCGHTDILLSMVGLLDWNIHVVGGVVLWQISLQDSRCLGCSAWTTDPMDNEMSGWS